MKIRDKINESIKILQSLDWSNPPIQLLVEHQGKLATYLYNVGAELQRRNFHKESAKIAYKEKEAEVFSGYRTSGETVKDAEMMTRSEVHEYAMQLAEAERDYYEIKQIIDSVNTLIIACQVAIKEGKRQEISSNYDNR